MKNKSFQPLLLLIHSVIGWFLGAVAWRTCGRDCAASGMGATTQRKKLAYNVSNVCHVAVFENRIVQRDKMK
jgi:hypothetical protein